MSMESEVDGSEESKGSPSRWHREPSPLLQSPPTSEDETTPDAYRGSRYHSSSECSAKLELVGCAACGECFESSEALVEHQEHGCAGLLSDADGEDEMSNTVPTSRLFIECARCPELNFNGRCELIRHLKGHRQYSLLKSKCSNPSVSKGRTIFVKRICVCRLRPCRCPPRTLKKVRPLAEDGRSTDGAVLCHMCFAGKLSLDKEAEIGAKTGRAGASPSRCVQCTMCSSESQRQLQKPSP